MGDNVVDRMVDAAIRGLAQLFDASELWHALRKDPEAYRLAVRESMRSAAHGTTLMWTGRDGAPPEALMQAALDYKKEESVSDHGQTSCWERRYRELSEVVAGLFALPWHVEQDDDIFYLVSRVGQRLATAPSGEGFQDMVATIDEVVAAMDEEGSGGI